MDEGLLASQLYQQFLANSSEPKLVDPDSLYETWTSLCPEREAGSSSSLTEHLHSGSPTLKPKAGSNLEFHLDEPVSATTMLETQNTAAPMQDILDRSINCIPGLTKRQYSQLENCGFHTVGIVLDYSFDICDFNLQLIVVVLDIFFLTFWL